MKKSMVYLLLMSMIISIFIASSGSMVFATQSKEASPTASVVLVNGENISFDAYLIEGNNYFKLRDLATVVKGSKKQFEVKWDESKRAINLISNKSYTKVGGEMSKGAGGSKSPILNLDPIYKDGSQIQLSAYNIDGNNYFKLRDIAKVFDIGITYDEVTRVIGIDTSISYVNTEKEEDDNKPVSKIDLSTEKAIRKYLQGEWIYDYYYRGDIVCKMNIDKDLNLRLSFKNTYSNEPKGDYAGKIVLDRLYVNDDDTSDLISIELDDKDKAGGDFLFTHRTIYDGKRVMSMFFSGNGNSIFDAADPMEDFISTPEEIIFEKISGEKSKDKPLKNHGFHAVYWGKGRDEKSMWLDDVEWTPVEYDYDRDYPALMINYKNDKKESVLYSIVPEEINEIFGDDLTESVVYYVETDNQGRVKYFIGADTKAWIESNYITPEIREEVYNTLKGLDQANKYLKLGMTIEFEGDTEMINGDEYYEVILGTQHGEDHFVKEIFYYVDTYSKKIYEYDALKDAYKLVSK